MVYEFLNFRSISDDSEQYYLMKPYLEEADKQRNQVPYLNNTKIGDSKSGEYFLEKYEKMDYPHYFETKTRIDSISFSNKPPESSIKCLLITYLSALFRRNSRAVSTFPGDVSPEPFEGIKGTACSIKDRDLLPDVITRNRRKRG